MVIDHCMQPMWYWTGLLKKEAKTTGHRQILSHNSFKRQQRNPKKHQENKNRRTPTREDKMQPKKPSIPNADLIERNCTWARISIQTLFFIKNAQWCTAYMRIRHAFTIARILSDPSYYFLSFEWIDQSAATFRF